MMTSDDKPLLSEGRPANSKDMSIVPCVRHTLSLVINLSAKVLKTG